MTLPASVRGFNLKNHEELKKKSQLIEKWRRFSLGVGEKTPTPGTDRVKKNSENILWNFPIGFSWKVWVGDTLLNLSPTSARLNSLSVSKAVKQMTTHNY